jgi:3-hydroxyisobutyrate dehydrogenase-like beta-hydroxyacid dehydrogenase
MRIAFIGFGKRPASIIKMLRSVFSKGLEALLIEFLVAGERAGM